MRILFFSNTYKPSISGVVTSISLFRQGLRDANHEVHIIAPDYEDFVDEEPYVFRFPALDLSDRLDISLVLPFHPLMEPTVRGIKPNLIHSQHPVWMGDLAVTFAREQGIPLVFTFHTRYDQYAESYVPIVPGLASRVAVELVRRYLRHCAHIIAPTPSIQELIYNNYAVDVPVTVVSSPVDLDRYHDIDPKVVRTQLGLMDAEILLYVGRLAKEKDIDFILNVFARIVTDRPQARLVLVGDGPYRRVLEAACMKLGIFDRVYFTGMVPHHEIPLYATAADVFVFASKTDTQGLVLIEAMAAGTPVVSVKAPGPVDVLANGGGLLVDSAEDEFYMGLLSLLRDEQRRREMGMIAKRIAETYSIRKTTEHLLGVYEAVLREHS
jgi:glycosyltransferase involved in cell wall biosynthesis